MDTNRAILPGYMTVGEVAKKMNTTVRTPQYYDRERLLATATESEGGHAFAREFWDILVWP